VFYDKDAERNLHQEFISCNVINNLIISSLIEENGSPEQRELQVLRVPVTSLVKYMGYTFLCQGDTMCDGISSLIFGPMGNTFKFQEDIKGLLNIIGRNLNLKSFNIITSTKSSMQIPFCLTVELHQVNFAFRNMSIINWFNPESKFYPSHQSENKLLKPVYYLMGFSKLWPLFIDNDITLSSGYLRPDAVLAWKKELSNVAFSNLHVEKDGVNELDLAEACKFVKDESIK
jgi:hypothetical protein